MTVPGYQGTLGATIIATHIEPIQAFGLELILTFVVMLTYVSDPTNFFPTSSVLLAASLVGLPCTGAGLNPARSLGPAFVMYKWTRHWVFWLGPILGAILATYFHKYILKRKGTTKCDRTQRSQALDGDSLDIPPTDLAITTPDRLLCERLEPIYGGTRSLYLKPSPVLPRTTLSRSQSVYASRRLEYPPKFLESASTSKKLTSPPQTGTNTFESGFHQRTKAGLLMSGPPSYESYYSKSCDKSQNHGSHHHHHHNHNHHHRDKSSDGTNHHRCSSRSDTKANRILAQYETTKDLVDVDPKAAILRNDTNLTTNNSQGKPNYYETSEILRKHGLLDTGTEKKYFDGSSESESATTISTSGGNETHNRFRSVQNSGNIDSQLHHHHQHHRFPSVGQSSTNETQENELNRANSINKRQCGGLDGYQSGITQARKPYEMMEGQKLMEFSPKCVSPQQSHHQTSTAQQQRANHYSPRLLMEKDSTYSRILDPILNLKSPNSNGTSTQFPNSTHKQHRLCQSRQPPTSPPAHFQPDHLTYSYH